MPAHCTPLVRLAAALFSSSRSHPLIFSLRSQPGCTHSERLDSATLTSLYLYADDGQQQQPGGGGAAALTTRSTHWALLAHPCAVTSASSSQSSHANTNVISSPIQGIHCAQNIRLLPFFFFLSSLLRCKHSHEPRLRSTNKAESSACIRVVDLHCLTITANPKRATNARKFEAKLSRSHRDHRRLIFLLIFPLRLLSHSQYKQAAIEHTALMQQLNNVHSIWR